MLIRYTVFCALLGLPLLVNAEQSAPASFSDKVKKFLGPVPSQPFWNFQASVWTTHYSSNPEHNNNQELFGLERHRHDSYLYGAATFKHSFGKRSAYVYGGKRYEFGDTPFFGKLTAGLLHGYRGEYRDKIPFNRYEIAPAIIPSVGVNYKMLTSELVFLGNSAAMITVGLRFGSGSK